MGMTQFAVAAFAAAHIYELLFFPFAPIMASKQAFQRLQKINNLDHDLLGLLQIFPVNARPETTGPFNMVSVATITKNNALKVCQITNH
jgi:hypothetical protein